MCSVTGEEEKKGKHVNVIVTVLQVKPDMSYVVLQETVGEALPASASQELDFS